MSEEYDEDFEQDSPKKKESNGAPPSWLQPLNKRAMSQENDSVGSVTPQQSPVRKSPPKSRSATPASIPPTPVSSAAESKRSFASRSATPPSPRSPTPSDKYSVDNESVAPPNDPPSWSDPKPNSTSASEVAELRRRNAELQAAVAGVKEQLAKVAPKLSAAVKRKHSAENDRLNKLQDEASQLRAEHARLLRKMKDVEHVKQLESHLEDRLSEIKTLTEKNKLLQVEVRNNAKKLKQMATVEEQRAKLIQVIKQEQKVAQIAAHKAERDADLAVQARDGASQRLKALEAKDRIPELRTEDVRQLIDLKQSLATKQETIEALQYRLSVLKRAHDSLNRNLISNPTDGSEIEVLRAEVVQLRSKLAGSGIVPPKAQTSSQAREPSPAANDSDDLDDPHPTEQKTSKSDEPVHSSAAINATPGELPSQRRTERANSGAQELSQEATPPPPPPTMQSQEPEKASNEIPSPPDQQQQQQQQQQEQPQQHRQQQPQQQPKLSLADSTPEQSKPDVEASPERVNKKEDPDADAYSSEPEWLD